MKREQLGSTDGVGRKNPGGEKRGIETTREKKESQKVGNKEGTRINKRRTTR